MVIYYLLELLQTKISIAGMYISYTPMSSHVPTVEFALSASAVDILIELLQEKANEVRFINGEKLIDYPKPKLLKIKKSGKDRLNKNR